MDVLEFGEPVTHVYNPLVYARASAEAFIERYGEGPKEAVFLGMNPGPWGMAQTGVPFGEIAAVTEWMGIDVVVDKPRTEHEAARSEADTLDEVPVGASGAGLPSASARPTPSSSDSMSSTTVLSASWRRAARIGRRTSSLSRSGLP